MPHSLLLPVYLLAILCDLSPLASALKFPVHGRTLTQDIEQPFARRADVSGTSPLKGNVTVPIANSHNAQYISNITLGGITVPVLLDTGSSDLWVNFVGQPPQTTDLGKAVKLAYAVGQARGNVHTTEFKMDDYTIPDQAFLMVTDTSTFSSDIHAQGYAGLLGLGPNVGSVILDEVDDDKADTALERIFQQAKPDQNFISFLLDRRGDPTPEFTGQITISEYVQGVENITTMPKLPIHEVHKLLDSDQHWQVLTDKDNGIIGPDGQVIKIKSIVPSAPKGQLVAVIDSGFTFSQVPRDVSDAIYGRVRGAVYDSKNEYWTVPCGQELNVSFNLGGQNYPIHPLDLVNDNFGIRNAQGETVCIGAFQPITSAFSLLGNYDMILGMSFLRNTYTLLDFGNWIKNGKETGDPFVQLLSVTNVAETHSDFAKVRLDGNPNADSDWSLLPADQMQHSPISDEEKKKRYQEMVLSRWPYIFVGCLLFVLILVGFCVWRFCCRRKVREARAAKKAAKNSGGGVEIGLSGKHASYAPLQESQSAYNLSQYNGHTPVQDPHYGQQYQESAQPSQYPHYGDQQHLSTQSSQQFGHYNR
jgi:hypothetical protein